MELDEPHSKFASSFWTFMIRGDIILIELFPQAGSEMAGQHRVIVLSEQAYRLGRGVPDHDQDQRLAV